MRALIVVLALATTPFLVGVSQSPQGLNCDNGQGDEHRSDSGEANAHRGLCALQPPPPPPGCVNSAPGAGTATITGQVFVDDPTQSLLAGWCVELRDAATGAVVATTLSTATGLDGENNNFLFTGVPIGNYTVCEVVPTGWHQTFPWSGPACSTGLGQSAPIAAAGSDADFNWFGNLQN